METKKRKSAWVHDPDRIVAAERALRESRGLLRNPDGVLLSNLLGNGVGAFLQELHFPLLTDADHQRARPAR